MSSPDEGEIIGCLLPLAALAVIAIGFLLHVGWDLY